MTTVTCPDCGSAIDPRGLSGHMRGLRCLWFRDQRVAEQAGLLRCDRYGAVRAADIPLRRLVCRYYAGSGNPRQRSRVTEAWYAPAWAVHLAADLEGLGRTRQVQALRAAAAAGGASPAAEAACHVAAALRQLARLLRWEGTPALRQALTRGRRAGFVPPELHALLVLHALAGGGQA